MRKTFNSLLVLAAFAAAFQAGSLYRQRTVASANGAERQVVRYICPMHPGFTSDRPGDAPCCGMRLERVPAVDSSTPAAADMPLPDGAVSVGAAQQQLIGVQVEAVAEVSESHTLRLPGRIAADERRLYSVNAGLEGTIRDVSPVTTGSRVRRHQVLGTYTAPEFLMAVQSFIIAADGLERMRAGLARDALRNQLALPRADPSFAPIISKSADGLVIDQGRSVFLQRVDRLQLLGMSDVQIEEVRETRAMPESIKILAPAAGTVLARNVRPGWKFMRGEEWFRIADLRRVWVVVDASGAEAQHIRAGHEVRVRVPDVGTTVMARVADVAPEFDAETRRFKIRLEADNPGEILRPDMFVDVEFAVDASAAIVVPVDAVIDTGLRKTIYVEHTPGVFEPREVETGWRRGDRVEVLHGLSPGDRIVTSGTFLLDSETRMRRALVRTAAASAAKGKDPICGMDVDMASANAAGRVSERQSTLHYFCSNDCKRQFDGTPTATAGAAP